MVALSPQIWTIVLSSMNRSDLLNIAFVSRAFFDPTRRILAQTVTLNGEKGPGYQEYIDHLRRHGLLPLIKKLVAKMVPLKVIPWMEMPKLVSLSLGPVCADWASCPKDWTKALSACLAGVAVFKLEEITILSEFPLPHGRLVVPNIKKVTWSDGGSPSLPFFMLCQASLQSITELTLFVTDDPFEKTATYVNLWKLRFPKLRLLNIGPGSASFHNSDFTALVEAFTQFLLAHPAMDSLTMDHAYDPDFEDIGDICLPLHSPTVSRTAETILPNLTLLHAHPHQIQMFVDADARFLRTLSTLSLPQEPYLEFESLMPDLLGSFEQYNQRNGGPSGIRHLSLFLFDVNHTCALDISEFKDVILHASEVFPELQVWEGTVPRVVDLEECFPKFPHLKNLHCRSEYGKLADVEDVRKLAELCPSLETYRCVRSGREFEITREGTEGRVYVRISLEGRGEDGENNIEGHGFGDEAEVDNEEDGEFDEEGFDEDDY